MIDRKGYLHVDIEADIGYLGEDEVVGPGVQAVYYSTPQPI
jgi:hypothetical protein